MPASGGHPSIVYQEQLSSLGHGTALWEPSPIKNFYDQVSIGDVGYIRNGLFYRMFNVTREWNDTSNKKLCEPRCYERLADNPTNIPALRFGKGEYIPSHISSESNINYIGASRSSDGEGTTYKCKGRGALLLLPHDGCSKDAMYIKVYEKYIRDNVVSWLEWANDKGLDVDCLEDLILVTGCTMVTSWAAATFVHDSQETEISLAFQTFGNGQENFIWSRMRGNVPHNNSEHAPQTMNSSQTPNQIDRGSLADADNPCQTQDQCVFIRGFRATRSFFRIKTMRAAAEPLPDDPDNGPEDDIQVTQVPGTPQYRDALVGVLDYIVENCPEGIMAIVHDDDLKHVNVETITADAVEKFLCEREYPVLIKNGVAILDHQDGLHCDNMRPEEQDIECPIPPGEKSNERPQKGNNAPIQRLPLEILETIFSYYCQEAMAPSQGRLWEWQNLCHVCKYWRTIVTVLSHRLGVRLFCTNGTKVSKILRCWPNFQIVMWYGVSPGPNPLATGDEDGIIAALQETGRIWTIDLSLTESLLRKLNTITEEPFPVLRRLELTTQSETGLVLPGQFLRGGAPHLSILHTVKIAFLALPQLLSSAKNLVSLQLEAIPSGGYIPPGDLVPTLSGMDTLQMLHIEFLSPTSDAIPDLEEFPQHSPTRVKLPVLKYLEFHGDYQYLEYLLACVDAPVKYIYPTFFYDPCLRTLQLQRFITRLNKNHAFPDEATVCYSTTGISISFDQLQSPLRLGLRILCRQFAMQMESLANICGELVHSALFSVRQLDIYASSPLPDGHDDPDLSSFVALLHRFDDVESLHVTKEIGSHVAKALVQNTMLPKVREIYLEEHPDFPSAQNALVPFITARQRDHRAVTLHTWQPYDGRHPSSNRPRTVPTRTSASFTDRNDPALMLEEDVQEMCERSNYDPHAFAIQSLYQRAQFLILSFIRNRQVKLDKAIEIASDLLEMRPRQIGQLKLFRMLAFCFALGGQRDKSASMFESAFQDESATTSERLNLAWWWATLAREWDHSSTTLAYQSTLSAFQSSLTGTFTVQLQPVITGRLGSKIQIPSEYASYRIQIGQPELAVETIEQGKMLIWSEIYGLWPGVGGLLRINPDLADTLASVSEELADVNASILAERVSGSRLNEEEDHEDMDGFSPMLNKRRRLLRQRQDVISAIKHLPGFDNFMEPIPYRTLQHAASRGPIIIMNHCPWHCDVLIVLHNSPPSHIPMTDGFYERANNLARTLLESRTKHGVESEPYEQELRSVLKELHERVGQPVINKLRELGIPEQSRVWWYPTSVFCSLPLHAMGPVLSTDGRERYFSDLYTCSYTRSLYALIAAAEPISDPRPSLLFVGRAIESLLGMRDVKMIRSIGVRETRLIFGNATRDTVIKGLRTHGLAHFAYGSHRESGEPFDTALKLDGGDRLTLLDLVRARVPAVKLAILAASATAELVDGTDFVEGLSLAAAMQYYGFGSVVGTMWDFGDGSAEDLSLGFYNQIVSGGAGDTASIAERSAEALQYTVQKLREKGVTLQRWVNWVHYGA